MKLELSEEKTYITQARGGTAHFLGTEICKKANSKKVIVRKKGHLFRQRISSGNLHMNIPIEKIAKKLVDKKVIEVKDNKWIMKSLTHLIPLPDRDIIIRYKATLNGLLNYYRFADNIKALDRIF